MSSEKLRKYLKYYQKVLTSDPENIEARLRLAAIFRELGKISHAVDEYVTASKLLAKEGLPLEAIAACKAVLELDPTQTEIQYFLARLFAQIPNAGGITSRIVKPRKGSSPEILALPVKPIQESISDIQEAQNRAVAEELGTFDKTFEEKTEKVGFAGPEIDFADEDIMELVYETDVFEEEDDDESEQTSPLERAQVDKVLDDVLTKARLPAIPKSEETRVANYLVETIGNIESFEVGVFDIDDFELDLPSEEIDFTFLEELEISLSETSALEEPIFERVEIDRQHLPRIPLFSNLKPETFIELLNKIELRTFAAGKVLLSPSADEIYLWILIKGNADVTRLVDGKIVILDTLKEGEFFGEFRLLTGRAGSATITSTEDVEILRINEATIDKIAENEPDIWDVLWEFYHGRMLNNLLATGPIFKSLDPFSRLELTKEFSSKELVADELLLGAGETCDFLYLILTGEVVVERDRHGLTEELAALREGEFFGVASSLDQIPYIANVRAVRDTTVLCLPAENFRKIVRRFPEIEDDINRFVSSRRKLNDVFTSGMTAYGELGVYRFED